MVWPDVMEGFVGYFRIKLGKKAARSGHESSLKAGLSAVFEFESVVAWRDGE